MDYSNKSKKIDTAEIKFLKSVAGCTRKDQIRTNTIREKTERF
jgi:hypothetical protein